MSSDRRKHSVPVRRGQELLCGPGRAFVAALVLRRYEASADTERGLCPSVERNRRSRRFSGPKPATRYATPCREPSRKPSCSKPRKRCLRGSPTSPNSSRRMKRGAARSVRRSAVSRSAFPAIHGAPARRSFRRRRVSGKLWRGGGGSESPQAVSGLPDPASPKGRSVARAARGGVRPRADNRIPAGHADRLAQRRAALRASRRHLARGLGTDALSALRGEIRSQCCDGDRACAAVRVCDGGRRPVALAAPHSADEGASLLDHLPHAARWRGRIMAKTRNRAVSSAGRAADS